MLGISVCRNQNLANVFYRLQLIEAYGTGIAKIMKAYEGMTIKPVIETTKNAFKIILPNINAASKSENKPELPLDSLEKNRDDNSVSAREKDVLTYVQEHGSITRNVVIELLGVSSSTAVRILKDLVERELLKRNGKARSTTYSIANSF